MVSVSAQEQSVTAKNMEPVKYKDTGRSFFDESDRGWHWYEDPLKDEVLEKPVEAPKAPKPPEKTAEPKPEKPPGPAPMSTEWMRENLPKYLGKAIDNPTDENVRAYLYLQKYTIDKAETYATASGRVTANDAYLDANTKKPMSNYGTDLANKAGLNATYKLVKDLSKTTGIMFFFRGSCEYCHAQWPILKDFAERFKFSVLPISLDGGILDGMDPKTVRHDVGQAEKMNITVVPTMILLKPPEQFSVISHGMSASASFPNLIIQAALNIGILNESTFLATSGIKDNAIRQSFNNESLEEVAKDPVKLVEYMKSKMKN